MKVFISSDMEGCAGIVDWSQCRAPGPAYEAGCALLLGEVNAAIAGAEAAGATQILVNDSHGAMANLPPDSLAGGASYLSGRHKPLYMMEGLDGTFDAVLFVGYHGSMGSSGILSHTYNPRAVYGARLNGAVTGEAGINALVALAHRTPIALVTGDQFATQEARPFCGMAEEVAVKESVTRFAALSMHPQSARSAIHKGAESALQRSRQQQMSLPGIELPATLEIDWLTADMAEMATWVRGVERTGERTVQISSADPLQIYRSFVACISLTRSIVEA